MADGIEVHFDDIEPIIKDELLKAQKGIKIAMGWFTIGLYYQVLLDLATKGVKIDLILNNSQTNYHSYLFDNLRKIGVQIKYVTMPKQKGHMHHKFCIIDNVTVLSGSYNWSKNAQTNFENIFIIRNEQKVTDKFNAEFEAIKHMELHRLQNLQNLQICPQCSGQLINILVFGRDIEKYGEAVGDLIQVCAENPYEHYKTIEHSIINNAVNGIADEVHYEVEQEYDNSDEGTSKYSFEDLAYRLDKKYAAYSNKHGHAQSQNGNMIHAWGKIHEYPSRQKREEDIDYFTKIYWKDKFVKSLIEDEYETTFDVY